MFKHNITQIYRHNALKVYKDSKKIDPGQQEKEEKLKADSRQLSAVSRPRISTQAAIDIRHLPYCMKNNPGTLYQA